MIDLHCHLLPGLDDGAPDLATALRMAEALVVQGVATVACTPHILPGLYHNSGPQIRRAVEELQRQLDEADVPLRLVTGADNRIAIDFVAQLRAGHLLSLNDSRYVLVEPPHHVAPARLESLFFELLVAGYVPILTHPERLRWIGGHYDTIRRLAGSGVLMQLTAGSLAGTFGREPRYWAERLLAEGCAHILATDAHDDQWRAPDLARGRDLAARRAGDVEAEHLVATRPRGVLANLDPYELPPPAGSARGNDPHATHPALVPIAARSANRAGAYGTDALSGRLRHLFRY